MGNEATNLQSNQSSSFQNEGIFAQLDKLDELHKTTYSWISIHLQSQKTL